MHEYGPVAVLFIAIVAGILFNRKDVSDLKADMNRQFDKVDERFAKVERRLELIEADQKQFFKIRGTIEGRIEELHRK